MALKVRICFPILLCFLFAYCTQPNSQSDNRRNQLAEEYCQLADSLIGMDTTNFSVALLRAYIDNDTTRLGAINGRMKTMIDLQQFWLDLGGIKLPALKEIGAQEAYRFYYGQFPSPIYTVITVGKFNDSTRLALRDYEQYWDTSGRPYKFLSNLIKDTSIAYPLKEWDNISFLINNADYWALKPENDRSGVDGEWLTVTGYRIRENVQQSHFVYRWSSQQNTLYIPFLKLWERFKAKH